MFICYIFAITFSRHVYAVVVVVVLVVAIEPKFRI